MKVAVLGAKIIGSTLARKWARAGHDVMFGVRNVDNPEVQALAQELGATVGTPAEAIAFGEAIVFAIPGNAMEETIAAHGPALAGKIAIDAANRMGGGPMNSAAAFAAHAPGLQVYRAFNSLGWENFEHPQFGDIQADLFYCGPGSGAQAAVEQLIRDVGLRPVRVGDLGQIGLVDTIGSLWFALAFGQGMGRQLAFKVLTREGAPNGPDPGSLDQNARIPGSRELAGHIGQLRGGRQPVDRAAGLVDICGQIQKHQLGLYCAGGAAQVKMQTLPADLASRGLC